MALDSVVFKNKKFSDLLGEIYDNSRKKDKQINGLIGELQPLVTNVGDATLIIPLIKQYLDLGVKNDEHLIKLAAIIQKSETSSASGNDDLFSHEELANLLKESENIGKKIDSNDK